MINFRFIGVVPVIFGVAGSALMSIIGATKTVKAFRIFFFGAPATPSSATPPHLDSADLAMIAVVESMDAFLISIALMVFSLGTYTLFIGEIHGASEKPWGEVFRANSVRRLKQVLMEVIMVILAVDFLRGLLFYESAALYWELLVVPMAIALIALSLKWVNWRN